MKLRSLISLVVGVTTCAAIVVADTTCFIAVPYTDPCVQNGVVLLNHGPCTNCADFVIWSDPVNDIFGNPTGFKAFHATTAACMVQRRRCVQTLPAGTWQCLANGVYTYNANNVDVDPYYPCDDGGIS